MQPNSKNFFFGAVIAILVIATVIFGVFWIGTKRELRTKNQELGDLQKQVQGLQTKLSGQKPQTLDTSNWKTYRNEKYGFEVRYQ